MPIQHVGRLTEFGRYYGWFNEFVIELRRFCPFLGRSCTEEGLAVVGSWRDHEV